MGGVLSPLEQGFRDQNRLFGVRGYLTLTPWPIVDSGPKNPHSRVCSGPSLAGLIRKIALIFDKFRSIG
jgi:hypothetical protein